MSDRTQTPPTTPVVGPSGWQARKSAATRLQILEATLRCFARLGYFHTTTPAIAAEAGVSRGAMLHHFPTRLDVVRAAIAHLHDRRLKAFRAAVEGLSPGRDRAHAALRAHWDQLRHPLYAVFIELYVAARTDPDLASILGPAEAAFVRELRDTAREVVPEWNVTGPEFEIGYELVTCTLRGMALKMFSPGDAEPSEDLFRYLEQQLAELAGQVRAAEPSPPVLAARN